MNVAAFVGHNTGRWCKPISVVFQYLSEMFSRRMALGPDVEDLNVFMFEQNLVLYGLERYPERYQTLVRAALDQMVENQTPIIGEGFFIGQEMRTQS